MSLLCAFLLAGCDDSASSSSDPGATPPGSGSAEIGAPYVSSHDDEPAEWSTTSSDTPAPIDVSQHEGKDFYDEDDEGDEDEGDDGPEIDWDALEPCFDGWDACVGGAGEDEEAEWECVVALADCAEEAGQWPFADCIWFEIECVEEGRDPESCGAEADECFEELD